MLSVAAKPLTWDDIKDWPVDKGKRTELVNGELIMSPAPSGRHQVMVTKLLVALVSHAEPPRLGQVLPGPVDVILAPEVVFQPDLCFVRRARLSLIQSQILGPPDICIEIISESNRTHDTVVKFQQYARYGVEEYWLVDDRDEVISSWRNTGSEFELIGRAQVGEHVSSLVLPDLELDPAKVFAGLLD